MSLGVLHNKIWPMGDSFLKNPLLLVTHSANNCYKAAALFPCDKCHPRLWIQKGIEETVIAFGMSYFGVRICKQGNKFKNNVPFRPKDIWDKAQFGGKDQTKRESHILVVGKVLSIGTFISCLINTWSTKMRPNSRHSFSFLKFRTFI